MYSSLIWILLWIDRSPRWRRKCWRISPALIRSRRSPLTARPPPAPGPSRLLRAGQVEGQVLELDLQVDRLERHLGPRLEARRREVEDRLDPGARREIEEPLRRPGRHRQ